MLILLKCLALFCCCSFFLSLCILPNFLEYYLLCRCLLPYRINCMTIIKTRRKKNELSRQLQWFWTLILSSAKSLECTKSYKMLSSTDEDKRHTGTKKNYEHDIAAIIKSFHILWIFKVCSFIRWLGTKNPVRNKNTLACVFGLFLVFNRIQFGLWVDLYERVCVCMSVQCVSIDRHNDYIFNVSIWCRLFGMASLPAPHHTTC